MPAKRGRRAPPQPTWVGWREWVALPGLGVDGLKAKLDTGAATSALHAIHIRRFQENGRWRVAFDVHPVQRRTDITVHCVADLLERRLVTSSTGHRENRFVIRTPLVIGGRRFNIETTLTNRDSMGFRMLIGRAAMKRRLVVDPSTSYRGGRAAGTGAGTDTSEGRPARAAAAAKY